MNALLLLLALAQQEKIPQNPVRDWRYEIEETNEQGVRELVAVIRGREAKPNPDKTVDITSLEADYYTRPGADGKSQKLQIEAGSGVYDQEKRFLKVTGEACILAEDGSALTIDDVAIDFAKRTFVTDKAFRLVKGGARLHGVGLDADSDYRRVVARREASLTLRGSPRAVVEAAADEDTTLSRVTCDGPMILEEFFSPDQGRVQHGRIDARDRVRAEREHPDGLIVATCDRLVLGVLRTPAPGSRTELVDAEATGNVSVRQGEIVEVRGDTARWHADDDVLRIDSAGEVAARMKGRSVRAAKAWIDRRTNTAHFEGGVRVEGTEPAFTAECAAFDWNLKEERGVLAGAPMVSLLQPDRTIEATRVLLAGGSIVILQGRKRIRIKQENLELDATCAGDALIDGDSGVVKMVDACRVRTQDFSLSCDRLRVLSEGPVLEAHGGVRVFRPAEGSTIFGAALRYAAKEQALLVRGKPHVVAETAGTAQYFARAVRLDEKTGLLEGTPGRNYIIVFPAKEKK